MVGMMSVSALLLDPNPQTREELTGWLDSEGYQVHPCAAPLQALHGLAHGQFAFVLCRVASDALEGKELARLAQGDPTLGDVPIVFLTAEFEFRQQALSWGGYTAIHWPSGLSMLSQKLRFLARLHLDREQLTRRQAVLDSFMAQCAEAVAIFDENGGFDYKNPPWQSLDRQLGLSSHQDILKARDLALRGHAIDGLEVEFPAQAGRVMLLSARPLEGRGSPVAALTLREMTWERQEARRLLQRQKEIEKFAQVAVHDLKAPLRHVAGFAEILERELEGFSPQVEEALTMIHHGVERMRRLVDSLLEKPEGRDCEWVGLGGVIDQAWEVVGRGRARLHCANSLPELQGDPVRLGQLFQNLLDNAIKFARPGVLPEIWVEARQRADALVISVRDNGIGVPIQHRQRIFGMFERVRSHNDCAGDGLGLAICARILEWHGGSIEVFSDGHSGSTFLLTFPRRAQRLERAGC